MKRPQISYVYLLLTILFWSATPAVAKLALEELDHLQLLSYTTCVGVVSLFLVVVLQGKINEIKKFNFLDYLQMLGMGFLGIFIYYIFLFGGFAIAPAGQANVVNYLWPVFVVLFSIPILKETFNYQTILAVLVSFTGALIVFTRGNLSSFNNEYTYGYLLAALAAVCYGLFSVLGKRLHYEKFTSMFFYYLFAALLIVPTTWIFSEFAVPKMLTTIVSILLLGGVFNSIAFVFWFKALKMGHTHKTANAIYAVPFLALIWTYALNSESIRFFSVVGLALIIAGIVIQMKNKA